MYVFLYYLAITIFRFILAMVNGSPSKKIQYLTLLGVFNGIIGITLIF